MPEGCDPDGTHCALPATGNVHQHALSWTSCLLLCNMLSTTVTALHMGKQISCCNKVQGPQHESCEAYGKVATAANNTEHFEKVSAV